MRRISSKWMNIAIFEDLWQRLLLKIRRRNLKTLMPRPWALALAGNSESGLTSRWLPAADEPHWTVVLPRMASSTSTVTGLATHSSSSCPPWQWARAVVQWPGTSAGPAAHHGPAPGQQLHRTRSGTSESAAVPAWVGPWLGMFES